MRTEPRSLPPPEPLTARLFRLLYRATGKKSWVDRVFSEYLTHRTTFASVPPQVAIPNYDAKTVKVGSTPEGLWASPLLDVVVVVKAAMAFAPKRILEIGSFRGYTARLLAEHTNETTQLWTLDRDPKHGSAYANTEFARRIHRLVGTASPELAAAGAPYDLVFIDADHDFVSVAQQTRIVWPLLSTTGVVFWHDYRHDTFFNGQVPEAIEASRDGRSVAGILGTMLAMHSSVPGWETDSVIARYQRDPDPIWGRSKPEQCTDPVAD